MRAVNLIPRDERSGGAGRSGGAAYALFGVLGILLLIVTAWALTSREVNQRKGEVARVTAQADVAQAKADKLAAYSSFSDLRTRRQQTVASIARSRFDWGHAMHEIARVIPQDAWLTSLTGSVSPTVAVQGGAGSGGSLRSSLNVPAAEIVGCTRSQGEVSTMMTRLRLIDLVQRVTLIESSKRDDAAGSATAANDADCRPNDRFPKFDLLVFFDPPPAAALPAAAGATTASATTGTAPAGSAQPASTSTSPPNQ